jgi:hypothetical protein
MNSGRADGSALIHLQLTRLFTSGGWQSEPSPSKRQYAVGIRSPFSDIDVGRESSLFKSVILQFGSDIFSSNKNIANIANIATTCLLRSFGCLKLKCGTSQRMTSCGSVCLSCEVLCVARDQEKFPILVISLDMQQLEPIPQAI